MVEVGGLRRAQARSGGRSCRGHASAGHVRQGSECWAPAGWPVLLVSSDPQLAAGTRWFSCLCAGASQVHTRHSPAAQTAAMGLRDASSSLCGHLRLSPGSLSRPEQEREGKCAFGPKRQFEELNKHFICEDNMQPRASY